MNPSAPIVSECIAALVKDFPVEDIWLLEPAKARECGLDGRLQLVVFVAEGNEAQAIEEKALRVMREKFGDFGLHVFTLAAMYQTPRPLLVKMAFMSGRQVFSR